VGDFELDTRLEAVEPEAGRFRARLSRDWEIWGPNGGYVAAIALRAAGRGCRIQRPASLSGHFLSVAAFEPVDVEVVPLRLGRRSESVRVSLRQDGKPVFEALVRTAADGPGLAHVHGRPPDAPPPESLPDPASLRVDEGPRYVFWNNLEARVVHPERFREPDRARVPIWREWYRFTPRATFDDPFLDAGRMLLLIDTLSWPAACQPHPRDSGFQAPNLDVTAWFHALAPECEWLLADHVSPVAGGGLMGTTGRIWSRDGRLLASGGAQLFCVPVGPAGRTTRESASAQRAEGERS
jgi:acyl-CoA thioesterase II